MGQVIVFDNPLDQAEHRRFEHTGPLIDFLLHEFPNGFHGGHITAVNGNKLAIEDYDREIGPDDLVTIVLFPSAPVLGAAIPALGTFLASGTTAAAITAAAINVAFSLSLSYAISAFTKPKTASPSYSGATGTLPTADSVYTFSGSANTARIGGTIPVAYGRNLLSPDLAMQPYVYFENNEQYLVVLNCLGQGEFFIHDIFMAGTNVSTLGSSVVSIETFPPQRHNSVFGTIQQQTGRFENVYTSPSVADQELKSSEVLQTNAYIGTWRWEGMTRSWFDLHQLANTHAEALRNGTRVWIYVESGPNQGSYEIEHIYHSDDTVGGVNSGTWYRYKRGWIKGAWPSGNGYLSEVKIGLSPYDGAGTQYPAGTVVGPFRATPRGKISGYLQYDIVFSGGVYATDSTSGTIYPVYVEIHFIAEPIDENGNVVGPPVMKIYGETFATTTPQRRTIHHNDLPAATHWQVRAIRFTPVSPRSTDQSDCHWVGLKAVLGAEDFGSPAYGDVTLISAKIKATEGLASNAHSAMTVDCTRAHLGTELRNPILAFIDILRNPHYGAARPASELDWDVLNDLAWDGSGRTFDAVFDNETTVWDALKLSVQMYSMMPVAVGSKISVVGDWPVSVPSLVFDESKIRSLTLSYSFVSSDDYDGVEGKYKNQTDNSEEYVQWPPDCVNPEEMTLWGCKNYDQALEFVKLTWKKRQYRRQLFSLELEGDGHVLSVGQAIGIKHPLLGGDVATTAVVSSVTPNSEFETSVEGFIYRSEVFS